MDLSLASILPRLFISMAVVIVVMFVAARVLKNRQISGSGTGLRIGAKPAAKPAAVQVLGRQGVGKNASVTIVRAGDRTLVLGVTDANVSLLTELETPAEAVVELTSSADTQWTGAPASLAAAPDSSQAWKGLLEQVRERTVRRS